jgi:hypothetical protein
MHKRLWLIMLMLLFAVSVAAAQTPEARDAVFADLSRRVGQTITLTSLTSWTWNFGPYTYITGLGNGCPTAPATSPTSTGDWQRFGITYQGVTYEYVISDNLQFIYLCNEATLLTPAASTPTLPIPSVPTAVVTTAPVGSRNCSLPTRLTKGGRANITPGDPNWVHNEPRRDASKIGEIPGGSEVVVVDGPQCDTASSMNYWLVRYTTPTGLLIGWTAEGLNGDYWLEPVVGRAEINAANATSLSPLALAQAVTTQHQEGVSTLALSDDATLLATADSTGTIRLWDVTDGTESAIFTHEGGVNVLALRPDGGLLATGGADGNIILWDTTVEAGTQIGVVPHGVAVTALAFSPDALVLATGSADGRLVLWNLSTPQAPVLLHIVQAQGAPLDWLAFSTDGTLLLARSVDGKSVQMWGIG